MTDQMPGIPQVGAEVAGRGQGTGPPDVCFASWVAGTPDGKLAQTREVRISEQPPLPRAGWQCPPDPRATRRRPQPPPPSRPPPSVPSDKNLLQAIRSPPGQTWLCEGDPRAGKRPTGGRVASPWALAGLGLACFLRRAARVTQTKANAKGFRAFLNEKDPGTKATSEEDRPWGEWGRGEETLWESPRDLPSSRASCGNKGHTVLGVLLVFHLGVCAHRMDTPVRTWVLFTSTPSLTSRLSSPVGRRRPSFFLTSSIWVCGAESLHSCVVGTLS